MLLAHKTTIKVNESEANIIGHMCYAASKLWNVCNYERHNYQQLGLDTYPDWYYQKKNHKNDLWFKQLPAQSAQEVCKVLDKSWKSFFKLKKTGGVENPRPPKYKKENIPVRYMQMGIQHQETSDYLRLSLSKSLMKFMDENYGINDKFLFLKSKTFENINTIKQVHLYPPINGNCEVIVIYEKADVKECPDNGHYLSIDLGLHNLMTCYDSENGHSFIIGRKYLSYCHYFAKTIAQKQSQWAKVQAKQGIQYPKMSKHVQSLYQKKNNVTRDYLHKITKYIVDYCKTNDVSRVVIGDIKGIRKNKNLGKQVNQQLHALPYAKIYLLLTYKLAQEGITLIKQNEAYSSQCSPLSPKVSKRYAKKSNRKQRGLYVDGDKQWNADVVGAYNILRLYLNNAKRKSPVIQNPQIIKVAA